MTGDVHLFQTPDDGDICVEGGVVEMVPGVRVAAYLSLFGGNEDDDGRPDNKYSWWGNAIEDVPEREQHSETQNLLQALPATTGNLRRVEDAASRDLAWLIESDAASAVSVKATMPAVNTVKITINIEGEDSLEFVETWE